MNLVTKMRTVAFQQPSLQAFFGSDFSTFRWFDRQLKQGALDVGTCAVVTTVSQVTEYLHPAPNPLKGDRVQIDVIDNDPDRAADAAAAIDAWLATGAANFVTNGPLQSPPVTDVGLTNFKLSQRGGLIFRTNRPIPVESLDYRILNVPS